ncbi:MAG: division/cell wall cluster transcriptional repressor MraZ [Pseudomonadales bacterium]
MFSGIASASLDAKGRMPLPTLYRDVVIGLAGGNVVVTIDVVEKCLMLYTAGEWDVVLRRLQKLPNVTSKKGRVLQRLLIGHATKLSLDSSGRILLPQAHRDYADLGKKVVTVGMGNKIELWSADIWDAGMDDWLSPEGRAELTDSDEFGSLQI